MKLLTTIIPVPKIYFSVYRKRGDLDSTVSGHRFLGHFKDGEFESYNLSAEENNEFKGEVKIIDFLLMNSSIKKHSEGFCELRKLQNLGLN